MLGHRQDTDRQDIGNKIANASLKGNALVKARIIEHERSVSPSSLSQLVSTDWHTPLRLQQAQREDSGRNS